MSLLKADELNRFHRYFEEIPLDEAEIQSRLDLADKILEVFAAVFASIAELAPKKADDDSEEWWLFFYDEASEFYWETLEDFGLTDDYCKERAEVASKQIVDTVKEAYENDKLDEALTNDKLIRIAWTETNIIENHDLNERQKAAGKTKKTWNTMEDEKVRIAHDLVDKVTVGIDEDFDVDGFPMAYPCDTSKNPPADLVVNCRCWLTYD